MQGFHDVFAPCADLGARAGVSSEDGKWSALLWGRNIFDTYHYYNSQVGYAFGG